MSLHNNRGYTLAEVMIALVISMILIAASSATYIAQNRSYVAQESVSEVNTQSKIAHDIVANGIRTAGFGTASDMDMDPVNTYTDMINVIDNTASPDAITVIGGFRFIGTIWPSGGGPSIACPATVPMGDTQIYIDYDGIEGPNMTDKRFLSVDGVSFIQVANCAIGGNGNCGNNITIDRSMSHNFPVLDTTGDGLCDTGRPVYLVEDVTFCVDGNSDLRKISRNANVGACTGLITSDNEVIAENIEDLQLAYGVDADGDGVLDGGAYVNNVADPSTIKSIRVNILARTSRADQDYTGLGNPPAVIENRNHPATNDDFRRRWWQTVVTMRNK